MKTKMWFSTCFLLVFLLAKADAGEPCDSPQYVVLEQTGTIQCNFSDDFFGIFWYNTTDYINEYSVLNLKESGISGPGYTSGEFGIYPNGSLIITEVNLAHDRNFTVVKLEDAFQEVFPHFVTVVVQAYPDPPYPIFEGCQQQRSCEMKVAHQGKLKCSVLGIHPRIDLAWKVFSNKSSLNLLHTRQHETKRADGRFDVHLVSEFNINNTSEYNQTVGCVVVATEGVPTFDIVTKVFLLFPEATQSPTNPTTKDDVTDGGSNGLPILLIVIIVLVAAIVIGVVGAVVVIKRANATKNSLEEGTTSKAENRPLLNVSKKSYELQQLISKLQKKYMEIYQATQPQPHIRSKIKDRFKLLRESDLHSLNFREGERKHGIWESVESVESVLRDPDFVSKKVILEADHGYVKSTLGVELAWDWCHEDQSSFTKEFEVLVYLKLSQLNHTSLTFNSLSTTLLGNDCKIGDKDIQEILASSSNVGVLLDGFNYFPRGHGDDSFDVIKLISNPIFKTFTVILISVPNPVENISYIRKIKKLRVCGVDKQTRDNFINSQVGTNTHGSVTRSNTGLVESDSVVSDNAEKTASAKVDKVTKHKEETKSVMSGTASKEVGKHSDKQPLKGKDKLFPLDILEIPLFFAALSQISKVYTGEENCQSITKFFSEMIGYLEHKPNKENKIESSGKHTLSKPNQQILHKIAFDGITFNEKQTKFWNKEELSEQMGRKFYESCKLKGYFIEEGFEYNNKSDLKDVSKLEIKVRFSNTFFCEWFAAHHLHHMQENLSSKKEKKELEDIILKLVSNDYWYCLRFLCGLSESMAENVLKVAKGREGMHFFCALEKYGGIVNTLDRVEKILSKDAYIRLKDSKLEQMSIIQLLDTKARNQIPIQHLFLEDCFNGPSSSSSELVLRSGLELPILDTLVELDIIEEGRTLKEPEAEAIFRYCLHCNNLKILRFSRCLLPQTVSGKSVSNEVKNLEVKWKRESKLGSFLFDFESRQWKKKDGKLITDEEYNDVVKDFSTT